MSASTTTPAASCVENGRIDVYAGNTSSTTDNKASFRVTGGTSTVVTKAARKR